MFHLKKSLLSFALGTGLMALVSLELSAQDAVPSTPEAKALTLDQVVRQVLDYNESLQIRLLEAEVARRQYKAEKGIFEPAVVGSYERYENERENTREQSNSLFGPFGTGRTLFNEDNDTYSGGLEFLTPAGSKFRLGYTMRDLKNTLNVPEGEYVSTVGLTLTQPLLKNFGTGATLARMRLAAVSSDVAYQEYRKQLMLIVSRAESAYWDLYLTQEQERISGQSVTTAESLLKDNRSRFDVGKSSELEVLQAEAGRALRMSRRNDALQKRSEAVNQLATLYSGNIHNTNLLIRAADEPQAKTLAMDYYEGYKNAFAMNPDYLTRRKQAVADLIRLGYAKNQRLPQLDLRGSYGFNGLGDTPAASFDDIERGDFLSWTVGVEMRIPVLGGVKEKHELAAARLNQKKSLVAIKEAEVQIGNALETAMLKVRNLRESIEQYGSVVKFHEQLLQSQMTSFEVGKSDSRAVLETEEKLFDARIAILESLVQYQKALLEMELIQGTTLRNRSLDITKPDLQRRTREWVEAKRLTGPQFDLLQKEIGEDYKNNVKKGR